MNSNKGPNRPRPKFKPVPSACRWKVGLDLGLATTVYQEFHLRPGGRARPICTSLPSLISYARGGDGTEKKVITEIGEAALRNRDSSEALSPLSLKPPQRFMVLQDYFRALGRELKQGQPGRPWGVISRPPGGCDQDFLINGGEIFDRFLLVEEHLLLATGILNDPAARPALIVDIGAGAVRASLIGCDLEGSPRRHVRLPGMNTVDETLKVLFLERHSELLLTDLTISRLREKLGFVAPADRSCQLRAFLNSAHRTLDITGIMKEACETLVPPVLRAIQESLACCPQEHFGRIQGSIYLTGGGAALQGFPDRIQLELERAGYDRAVIHCVNDPHSILALGALKWALKTPDDAWESPLIESRSAAGS